jgi:uncharacterized protein YraI
VYRTEYVRTTGNVYVRTGPARHYQQMCVLPKGSRVEYLGEYCADERGVIWYYVYTGKKVGWVSSKYSYIE